MDRVEILFRSVGHSAAIGNLVEPEANVLAQLLDRQLILRFATVDLNFLPQPPSALVADIADALHMLFRREPALAIALIAERLAGLGVIRVESDHRLQVLFALLGQTGLLAPLGHGPLR